MRDVIKTEFEMKTKYFSDALSQVSQYASVVKDQKDSIRNTLDQATSAIGDVSTKLSNIEKDIDSLNENLDIYLSFGNQGSWALFALPLVIAIIAFVGAFCG